LQVWLGYKQSLRPCENGLTLNIDVAATAFLSPQPVLKYLSNIVHKREEMLTLEDRGELRKAQKAMTGLKVGQSVAAAFMGFTQLGFSDRFCGSSEGREGGRYLPRLRLLALTHAFHAKNSMKRKLLIKETPRLISSRQPHASSSSLMHQFLLIL
jgi:hypothetical protein